MRTKPLEGWDLEFVNVALAQLFEMILVCMPQHVFAAAAPLFRHSALPPAVC